MLIRASIELDKKVLWASSSKFKVCIIKTLPIGEEIKHVRIDKIEKNGIIEGGYVRVDELFEYDPYFLDKKTYLFENELKKYRDEKIIKDEEQYNREIRERFKKK